MITLRLGPREVAALSTLPARLRELLSLPEGEVHDRLFPRAYLDPTEEEAEQEWQRLMHDDLLEGKLSALLEFEGTLARVADGGDLTLSEEEALSWVLALNDVRLALGTMLGVEEDAPVPPLYEWLTWLQGSLIEALDVVR